MESWSSSASRRRRFVPPKRGSRREQGAELGAHRPAAAVVGSARREGPLPTPKVFFMSLPFVDSTGCETATECSCCPFNCARLFYEEATGTYVIAGSALSNSLCTASDHQFQGSYVSDRFSPYFALLLCVTMCTIFIVFGTKHRCCSDCSGGILLLWPLG